ncbi:DUF2470 domain-containing protein [Streptomyces sp. NPDC049555]|uniref:DUF2470 domain-containing protein n=1 Tax=unclassified Streptomyces TaxID=2593676 RepID=UPI0034389BBF
MPSAAERTRTLVQSTCSAALLIPGAPAAEALHVLEPRSVGRSGEILLGSGHLGGTTTAVLELVDVAPVAVRDRIRGRARITGRLTCADGVLRLEPTAAYVDDLWGAQSVAPEDFARASADPLAAYEAELLQHLHVGHDDQVRALAALLDMPGCASAVPLALDRFGLRVRFTFAGGSGHVDARFEFPHPVGDIRALRTEMHRLFASAGL